MNDAVRYLGLNSTKEISVLPNAGLPQNEGGHAVYKLSPEELAKYHKHFVQDYGVRIVGGCCGTTPEHMKAVVRCGRWRRAGEEGSEDPPQRLERLHLRAARSRSQAAGGGGRNEHHHARGNIFAIWCAARSTTTFWRSPRSWSTEGSHMLDLCCAIVGEDEKGYITSILEKIATRVPAPILVDSTEADVVEEALKRIPGKAIINSINLEDGEKRTSKVLPMAKRYGAAVIALTIDEDGMALTAEKKAAIAHRIFDLATEKYGIRRAGHHFRCAHATHLHRSGGVPHRWHRNAERHQADQA